MNKNVLTLRLLADQITDVSGDAISFHWNISGAAYELYIPSNAAAVIKAAAAAWVSLKEAYQKDITKDKTSDWAWKCADRWSSLVSIPMPCLYRDTTDDHANPQIDAVNTSMWFQAGRVGFQLLNKFTGQAYKASLSKEDTDALVAFIGYEFRTNTDNRTSLD